MTPHDLLANFETLAEAPNGIPRLRELVLELAIRGKLVEQDLEEEPARRILERAKAYKAKCSSPGRQGKSSIAAEFDLPFDPPQGWSWAQMEDCCDIKSGVTKGRNLLGMECRDYPYLRVANVQAGYIDLGVMKTIPLPLVELDSYRLVKGDVLLTEGGDWDKLGRSSVWAGEIDPCIHQNHVFRARCLDQGIRPRWISSFTNSPDGRTYFQSCSKQTTNLASINMTQLKGCPLPIPPTGEQDRILARVDELMALLDRLGAKRQEREAARAAARDSAIAALQQAPTPDDVETAWLRIQESFRELFATHDDAKQLRKVIYHLGVRGSLVKTTATSGAGKDLLNQIKDSAKLMHNRGEIPKQKPTLPLIASDKPYDLPSSWTWTRLADICSHIVDCLHRTPRYSESGIPAIRTSDMSPGKIDIKNCRKVCENEYIEQAKRLIPKNGDIFYSREGNFGIAAVVPDNVKICLSQRMMQFRVMEGILPEYFAFALNSPLLYEQARMSTIGATVPHINIKHLVNFVFPLPTTAEQQMILDKANILLHFVEQLELSLTNKQQFASLFAAAAVHHLDA